MNKRNKALLLGLAIGDGYISPNQTLVLHHSQKQVEYLKHKVDILHSIFGGKRTNIRFGGTVLKATGKYYPQCSCSKSDRYFKVLRKVLYPGGKKYLSRRLLNYLTAEALALWYMDDGSLKACHKKADGNISSISLSISTYCTKEEAEVIQKYFSEQWGLEFRLAYHIRCNSYYIRIGTKGANKFFDIIRPYIIPSLEYKINPYLLKSQKARVPSIHKIMYSSVDKDIVQAA